MLLTIIKAARHSGITERAMRALIKEGKIRTRTVPKEELPFVRGLPYLVTVIHEDDLKPYMQGSNVPVHSSTT